MEYSLIERVEKSISSSSGQKVFAVIWYRPYWALFANRAHYTRSLSLSLFLCFCFAFLLFRFSFSIWQCKCPASVYLLCDSVNQHPPQINDDFIWNAEFNILCDWIMSCLVFGKAQGHCKYRTERHFFSCVVLLLFDFEMCVFST